MSFDELADVILQNFIRHAEGAAGIEQLLIQKEAVLASQVANGTRRLGQHVDTGRSDIIHMSCLQPIG